MGSSLYKSPTGDVVNVDDEDAAHAQSVGYQPLDQDQAAAAVTAPEQFGTGVLGGVGAAVTGGLSGLTLGASDAALRGLLNQGDVEKLRQMREAHPYASAGGQIAGALLPALFGDEAGLLKLTPAGFTSGIGSRVAERFGGGALGTAAAGALEGAAQNTGAYVSDVALGDRDLSAEGFLGAMNKGAFYGGVAGGALSLASNGLMAARRLIPAADATPEAAAIARTEATRAIRDSVDTSNALESTGRNAVAKTDRETQQFISDLEAERNAAMKSTIDAGNAIPGGPPELAPEPTGAPETPSAMSPEAAAQPEPAPPPSKSAPELLKDWRSRYPNGAVDFDAATAAARRQRLADWASGFEATTPEDAAVKAYFENPMDPGRTLERLGGTADIPSNVQRVARSAAADASHQAYLDATARATNVSQSGAELMARATYAGRKAAARALDDVYTAYRSGVPIGDIRVAASQKLNAELGELNNARADMIQSLAKDPDAAGSLLAQLTGTKQALDADVPLAQQSLGQRILAGIPKPVDPDEAIANALAKSKSGNTNVDIADVAPKITRYEAAKAQLTESLGSQASPDAIAHAQAFRQAQAEAAGTETRRTVQATEDINRATSGAPAETLPGGKSVFKGLAKQAGNLGTYYEALRQLGVPLPDPKSIPVVGPLLSLYLKAKLASHLVGRLGGRFAATAENTIAAKSAETQNRINSAIDAAFAGTSKAIAAKAPDLAGGSVLAMKLFDTGEPTTKPYNSAPKSQGDAAEYRQRLAELVATQQPGAVEQAVRARIQTSDPTIVDSIVNASQRAFDYLFSIAPKPSAPALPDDPPFSPSPVELSNFGLVLAAFHDPAAVFEKVAAGGVARPAEIATVQATSPKLFASAQMRAVKQIMNGGRRGMSRNRKLAVSNLIGLPLDSTMQPAYASFVAQGQRAVTPPPPTPSPTLHSNISLGQQSLTRLDR